MKFDYKNLIIKLLSIAFISAVISDYFYGKSELANEYLIGQLLGQIFSISLVIIFLICIIWFIYTFMKTVLNPMIEYPTDDTKDKEDKE